MKFLSNFSGSHQILNNYYFAKQKPMASTWIFMIPLSLLSNSSTNYTADKETKPYSSQYCPQSLRQLFSRIFKEANTSPYYLIVGWKYSYNTCSESTRRQWE